MLSLYPTINPHVFVIVGVLSNQATGEMATRLDINKAYNIKLPFLLIWGFF